MATTGLRSEIHWLGSAVTDTIVGQVEHAPVDRDGHWRLGGVCLKVGTAKSVIWLHQSQVRQR